MTEISYPFDAGPGATVGEAEWQRMAREWLRTGVLTGRLNQLAVSADGSGMQVSVASGTAWIEGFYYRNDAAKVLPIAGADPTNPRIDRIVTRLDRAADTITTVVVAGAPASAPVAPALTQTDALWEMPLATVLVDAAVGVIAAGKVTDGRTLVKNLTEAAASAAYQPRMLIAETVLAAPAAAITFASIPQTFRDLLLVSRDRTDKAAANEDDIGLRINGDTALNYDAQYVLHRQSTVSSFQELAVATLYVGSAPGAASAADFIAARELLLPQYARGNGYRPVSGRAVTRTSNPHAISRFDLSGFWRGLTPVTSLTLLSRTGSNFTAGSIFTLYGIV